LVAERAAGVDGGKVDLAHPPLLQVTAAQRIGVLRPALHSTTSGSRTIFPSSTFACRRFAAVVLPWAPPLLISGERATGLRIFGGSGTRCLFARFMKDPQKAAALRTTPRCQAKHRRRPSERRSAFRAAGHWRHVR